MDANFRLKNRLRSSSKQDPGLITGLAYFVDDDKYAEHLLKYVTEEEVRTPINFFNPDADFSTPFYSFVRVPGSRR